MGLASSQVDPAGNSKRNTGGTGGTAVPHAQTSPLAYSRRRYDAEDEDRAAASQLHIEADAVMARKMITALNGSSDGASPPHDGEHTNFVDDNAPNGSPVPKASVAKIRRKKSRRRLHTPSPSRTPTPPVMAEPPEGSPAAPANEQFSLDDDNHAPESSPTRIPATYDDAQLLDEAAAATANLEITESVETPGTAHQLPDDTTAGVDEDTIVVASKPKKKHSKKRAGSAVDSVENGMDEGEQRSLVPLKKDHSRTSKKASLLLLADEHLQAEIAASQDQGETPDDDITHQDTTHPEDPTTPPPRRKRRRKNRASVSTDIDVTEGAAATTGGRGPVTDNDSDNDAVMANNAPERTRPPKKSKRRRKSEKDESGSTHDEDQRDDSAPSKKRLRESKSRQRDSETPHRSVESADDPDDTTYPLSSPQKTVHASSTPNAHGWIKGTRRPRKNFSGPLGAEREINIKHDLPEEPLLLEAGPFSPDERELLRRAIKAYMAEHNMDLTDMVRLIQWVVPPVGKRKGVPNSKEDIDVQAQGKIAREFWKQMRDAVPTRTAIRVSRCVRRYYHNYEKGGGQWTEEEDARLKELIKAYSTQWEMIAAELGGRGEQDCRDRWRNYLQYGDKLKHQRWTKEEEKALAEAYFKARDKIQEDFADRGEYLDEYEISEYVNWQAISHAIGGTRSRLQCSIKWKAIGPKWGTAAYVPPKTPRTSLGPRRSKTPHVPATKMLWGDKVDLISHIIEAVFNTGEEIQDENDIDWDAVSQVARKKSKDHWSTEDRIAALKELLATVRSDEEAKSFRQVLGDVLEYIKSKPKEEISKFYDIFEVETDEDAANGDVKHTKARKSRQRKSKTAMTFPKKEIGRRIKPALFKSEVFITASDDENEEDV